MGREGGIGVFGEKNRGVSGEGGMDLAALVPSESCPYTPGCLELMPAP